MSSMLGIVHQFCWTHKRLAIDQMNDPFAINFVHDVTYAVEMSINAGVHLVPTSVSFIFNHELCGTQPVESKQFT